MTRSRRVERSLSAAIGGLRSVIQVLERECGESGQIAVMAAIVMTVILASTSLAVDVGMVLQERRQLQTAVDAAALAAASEAAEGGSFSVAREVGFDYLMKNSPKARAEISMPTSDRVRVKGKSQRETFLARIFGKKTVNVGAVSTAAWAPARSVRYLAPFAVPRSKVAQHVGPDAVGVFEFGDDRPLTEQGWEEVAQKGYFWLVDFDADSGGNPDYRSWIVNGYPGEVGVGQIINGTGVRASLGGAMEERLRIDPKILVPVYSHTAGEGRQGYYKVTGFAELFVTGFEFTGNPKSVTGYFTEGTVADGTGSWDSEDYGVRAVWLTE